MSELSQTAKLFATLVRGNVYILGEKIFETGVPVEVTAAEKATLEADAVDYLTVEEEEVARAKFTFTDGLPAGEDSDVSGTQSRPRTRSR